MLYSCTLVYCFIVLSTQTDTMYPPFTQHWTAAEGAPGQNGRLPDRGASAEPLRVPAVVQPQIAQQFQACYHRTSRAHGLLQSFGNTSGWWWHWVMVMIIIIVIFIPNISQIIKLLFFSRRLITDGGYVDHNDFINLHWYCWVFSISHVIAHSVINIELSADLQPCLLTRPPDVRRLQMDLAAKYFHNFCIRTIDILTCRVSSALLWCV